MRALHPILQYCQWDPAVLGAPLRSSSRNGPGNRLAARDKDEMSGCCSHAPLPKTYSSFSVAKYKTKCLEAEAGAFAACVLVCVHARWCVRGSDCARLRTRSGGGSGSAACDASDLAIESQLGLLSLAQ